MEEEVPDLNAGSSRVSSKVERGLEQTEEVPQGPTGPTAGDPKGKAKQVGGPREKDPQTVTANGTPKGDMIPSKMPNPSGMQQGQEAPPGGSGGLLELTTV